MLKQSLSTFKKRLGLLILLVGITVSSFSFRYMWGNEFEIVKNMELYTNILEELSARYVDELDYQKLTRSGIDAMLRSLDPYTTYIAEEDMSQYQIQTTGRYGGIGSLIRQKNDHVIITDPYEGFPAQKADLRAGDKILSIDGTATKGLSTTDVSRLLKGTPGTDVDLKIERVGEDKTLTKTLTREEVQLQSVPYYGMLDDKTGYILLTSFTDRCSKDVADALVNLKNSQNATSVILDLRGNPGGLLGEAVDVANLFIERGQEVVSTRDRENANIKNYRAKSIPVDTKIPLAILIDRGSASAAEIVSGVMQDLDRGVVVGQRSFGKGLVQTTKDVGYDSRIKVTTAKYYLPSGRCIQAVDYSGGYSDQLERIPDSLRTKFYTNKGRMVYDAGGVDPDLEVESELLGNISRGILRQDLLFDYANLYRSKNSSIPKPSEFELDQGDVDQFIAYIKEKEFDYDTQSEQLIKQLRETAEDERYLELLQSEIDALEARIDSDKEKDIARYSDQIEDMLETEIVSRYYYQKGEIEESLEEDPIVSAAKKLVQNSSEMKRLLKQ